MSKHTKGPWIAEFTVPEEGWNGFYILTKDERLYIADAAGYQDMPERAANARLIAAAPDMFELLLDIVADYHAGDMDVQSVAHEAKRLIAKVRGEVTP